MFNMFLGHDGWFWKINWKIFLNHIMKNFKKKHGQCDSIKFPKTYSFESSKYLLVFCIANNRFLYLWLVLESIHKFIAELHVLQCLFVKKSNKKQRRGRVISNFKKGGTFSSLMTTKCFWRAISEYGPLLSPSKKGLSVPFSLVKKRIYLGIQLKGELTDLFWKLAGCSLILRVGIGWWTLL